MQFLSWHYSSGLQLYMQRWMRAFDWVLHYFSISELLGSLFAPWKRLIEDDDSPGFNPQKFFEILTFNLISRFIGAAVRACLIFVSVLLLIMAFFAGIFGLIVWMIIPPLSYPAYKKVINSPENFMNWLNYKIAIAKDKDILVLIFGNDAGKFVSEHIGVELKNLLELADNTKIDKADLTYKSFRETIDHLVEKGVWGKDNFRKLGLLGSDLIDAAGWWEKKRHDETTFEPEGFGRPGIALELLYGYTPTLNQYSVDMSTPQSYSHHLIGRENVVSQMERVLTGGHSVVLVGEPGVGKKTVVLEFARRASSGNLGPALAHRRILEFDYNSLLSEASDLNQKKRNLSLALKEAAYAGNIILMVRDIHRLTHPEVEGNNFTDVFEENMQDRDLKIIAVTTPSDYEKFIVPNMRLRKFLADVKVTPPTKEQAFEILMEAAQDWEKKSQYTITIPTLRKILDESDKYITETPFPEKALELLDSVILYCDQQQKSSVTVEDANVVLAEKTGVSFSNLTDQDKGKLAQIEDIIHKRLINQEAAVDLIGKSLRSKTVGVAKEKRPTGSFLFLGPTGVGKTETAKVLAKVYFGSEENILRFDMAEYAGQEGLERLIGSVSKNQPGVLTTAIKNKPSSLLLLDEFEKAPREIFNLFLALLDEGMITDAFGKKIIARHLFVIATSNAGAEYIRQLVNRGMSGEQLQKEVVNHVLEKGIYTPELLNRFDGVIVYEPLKHEHLIKIAYILLKEMADNLENKGIKLNITQELADKVAKDGYEPEFGARPMKRVINLILGDLLGKAILTNEVREGDTIEIVPGQGSESYIYRKISS
ncbi:ATP-dependent Clp protease ATP-binding subunit [Candidatus Woesebacteria bacterium]|nr:ATP-dependent Clp protease ATP-binding subunit [Candidatus Woesebacteria bacterium]